MSRAAIKIWRAIISLILIIIAVGIIGESWKKPKPQPVEEVLPEEEPVEAPVDYRPKAMRSSHTD